MRIREGDPLEIYTSKDGEVIFKKYSLMGGVDEFAAQLCETLSKSTGTTVAVTDRDSVIAAAAARAATSRQAHYPQLEQIMEGRGIYRAAPSERSVYVTESARPLLRAHRCAHHFRRRRAGACGLCRHRRGIQRRRNGVQTRPGPLRAFSAKHMEC